MSSTYKSAGVDIEAAEAMLANVKDAVRRTHNANVLQTLSDFGGLYALTGYREPVLVSGTDGVGTKLKIAFALDQHDTIGQDLVAMCVDDIVVQGARPLFFLDYFATGKLRPETGAAVIKGIAAACEIAQCALIGGETAELPGFYGEGEYDLAGFAVGAVEKSRAERSVSRSRVSFDSRSTSSSLGIGRPNSSSWRAICEARLAGLSADITRPAWYCARARSSSSWAIDSPARRSSSTITGTSVPISPSPVAAWMPNMPVSEKPQWKA